MFYVTDDETTKLKITMKPNEKFSVPIHYSPLRKGRAFCDVKLEIEDNPFEYFTVNFVNYLTDRLNIGHSSVWCMFIRRG